MIGSSLCVEMVRGRGANQAPWETYSSTLRRLGLSFSQQVYLDWEVNLTAGWGDSST